MVKLKFVKVHAQQNFWSVIDNIYINKTFETLDKSVFKKPALT